MCHVKQIYAGGSSSCTNPLRNGFKTICVILNTNSTLWALLFQLRHHALTNVPARSLRCYCRICSSFVALLLYLYQSSSHVPLLTCGFSSSHLTLSERSCHLHVRLVCYTFLATLQKAQQHTVRLQRLNLLARFQSSDILLLTKVNLRCAWGVRVYIVGHLWLTFPFVSFLLSLQTFPVYWLCMPRSHILTILFIVAMTLFQNLLGLSIWSNFSACWQFFSDSNFSINNRSFFFFQTCMS